MGDVIWCEDSTEYRKLTEILKKAGYQWADGQSLDEYDPYVDSGEADRIDDINIYIDYANKRIAFDAYDAPDDALSLDEFIKALEPAPNVVYVRCCNRAEYETVADILSAKDYKWKDGKCVTEYSPYSYFRMCDTAKSTLCINRNNKEISCWPDGWSKDTSISTSEFIANEYLTQDSEDLKVFTKADLEDNMIVQTVMGMYYMYIKTADKFVRNDGFCSLSSYNDDLTASDGNTYLDIKSVYRLKDLTSFDLAYADVELIWSRPEEIVMTLSEVKKRLGIENLKIVSD